MAQSDARFGYRAKLARKDHDLSRPFGFTCAPGMELPVFSDIATPGDTYYIKHDLTYLRTAPLAAPAMIDCKVHFESFFVPMQMIYEPFENVIYQLKNQRSSLFNTANLQSINFPLFDYPAYISWVKSYYGSTVICADSYRLADHFRLNPDNFAYDANNSSFWSCAPKFFPWQLLAYQTIRQYYYRLDDKSQFDNGKCNWDKYYDQTNVVVTTDLMGIFQRPWRFDYYTSMYRSPIISDANMQEILPQGVYSDLTTGGNEETKLKIDGGSTGVNSKTASMGFAMPSSYNVSMEMISGSTAVIRQLFANEKLAMISGRTRKTYDAQTLAHFGFNVPHDVKHDITMIGRSTFDLHVGEVTSLASTNDAPLGELAGKGWSMGQGKQFKFEAPCHGVIMTLFCVEPEQRYYGGFDRSNLVRNATEIPQPEYDRLGNMPMYRLECGPGPVGSTNDDIVGWYERYHQWKRRAPQATNAFMHGVRGVGVNSYESYMIANRPFTIGPSTNIGSLRSRPDLEDAFYIPRTAVDSLMLVSYFAGWKIGDPDNPDSENWNKTPWLAYSRDPFIVDSFVKVKKVSWMSKDGEPVYTY